MLRNRLLEPAILIALLITAAGLWLFIAIAEEVGEGETNAVDLAIILALRDSTNKVVPLGPLWLADSIRDVSALGSAAVLSLLVVAVVSFLVAADRRPMALFTLVSVACGAGLSLLLKEYFERPRPDLLLPGVYVSTSSFPSGHAMMSTIVYLTLGALIIRVLQDGRLKLFVLMASVAMAAIVGLSRIYLGAHWPTDVIAGWMIGSAWAIGCWIVAQLYGVGDRS